MEAFNHNANSGERSSFRPSFNRSGSKGGFKPKRPHQGHGRDRQKGMVSAFVQGKGQNAALKWLMDSRTPVSVFLITGVKFEGLISAFDAFTISITDAKRHQQMIYKDKISTITVKKPEAPQNNKPRRPFQKGGFSSQGGYSSQSGYSSSQGGYSSHGYGLSRPVRSDGPSGDDGVTLPERHVNPFGNN
ncbi:MAG: RNA chaperone Hfq [Succinivibrio sp.]